MKRAPCLAQAGGRLRLAKGGEAPIYSVFRAGGAIEIVVSLAIAGASRRSRAAARTGPQREPVGAFSRFPVGFCVPRASGSRGETTKRPREPLRRPPASACLCAPWRFDGASRAARGRAARVVKVPMPGFAATVSHSPRAYGGRSAALEADGSGAGRSPRRARSPLSFIPMRAAPGLRAAVGPRSRPRAPREFHMSNKMIIDASHPEETRVVVLRGNRVEEFDFESASKKPLRGNIYLAKVTRVEPSLQAAFVDYGGNRHGFLAFSEIHPDYYQIPVADRQALLEEEARSHREDEDEPNGERRSRRHRRPRPAEAEARGGRRRAVSEPAPTDERLRRGAGGQRSPTRAVDAHEAQIEPEAATARRGAVRGRHREASTRRREAQRAEPTRTGAPARSRSRRRGRDAANRPTTDQSAESARATSRTHEPAACERRPSRSDDESRGDDARRRGARGARARAAGRAATTRASRSNRSAATRWRRRRAARRACAATTRSRTSSSAARCCWCRSSRKSAATRARR